MYETASIEELEELSIERLSCCCMFEAANSKNLKYLKRVINLGADVQTMNEYNWTILHKVCAGNWSEAIDYVIDFGLNLDALTIDDETALSMACINNNIHNVKALLEAGADPGIKIWPGYVALHWAAKYGNVEIFKMLLAAGADINAKGKYGTTPVQLFPEPLPDEILDIIKNYSILA